MAFDPSPLLPAGARELRPDAEPPEAWRRFHEFRLAMHRDVHGEDRPEPDAVAESRIRRGEPFYERRWFALERAGRLESLLRLSAVRPGTVEHEGHRHHVYADAGVLPERRRRGLARGWLPLVVAFAESRPARLVTADTESEPGHAFLRAMGFEQRFGAWESRLSLDRVAWDRMREWAALEVPGVRLERYQPFPPEAVWEEYARGYTEINNLTPREGLDVGDWVLTPERLRHHRESLAEQRKVLHVLAAWDGEGLAGVTEIVRAEHEPEALEQELTAVHPRARGRGLAKTLKARLLLEMRALYPQARFVRTYNAGSNDAMWAINESMGFVRHRWGAGYQAPVEALRERLA